MASLARAKTGSGNMGRVILLYLMATFLAALTAVIASFLFPMGITLTEAAEGYDPASGVGQVLNTLLLSNHLEGEAREVGTLFAAIAKEIRESGNPVAAPCVVVATGEMSVRIPGASSGVGGPGQEMAASFAIGARGLDGVCVISVDSEGTDGPTDSAGGITDSKTYGEAQQQGIDLYRALREHAVYQALTPLECEVITGNTGTNLCDLHILYVPAAEKEAHT